jgi:hypothetical protein
MSNLSIENLNKSDAELLKDSENSIDSLTKSNLNSIYGGSCGCQPPIFLDKKGVPIAIGGLACPPPITEEKK